MNSASDQLLTIAACVIAASCASSHTAPEAEQALREARGAIVRADGPEAIRILSEVEPHNLSDEHEAFRKCALARLTGTDAQDRALDDARPLEEKLLAHFRTYWREAVRDPAGADAAQSLLVASVFGTLNIEPASDLSLLESAITDRLQSQGAYSLQGRTGRLRELMIWHSQTERMHTVRLPEQEVTTRVLYLDDFSSGGWSSYLGCDTVGTGGWADEDALYVVVPRWSSLEDERFEVSFLAHESQHFADYAAFPGLAGWELEYRAKLVELHLANESRTRLIQRFEANQGDDPEDAHSYANRLVVEAVRTRITQPAGASLVDAEADDVKRAALDALLADTHNRTAQSANQGG